MFYQIKKRIMLRTFLSSLVETGLAVCDEISFEAFKKISF